MNRKMAYLRILCGILPFVFFFSLFAFYLLVEDMGWLARLLCILCVLGTLGVCLAFQVWFYRIVQSRRREEQRLALAQECVRQQSLRPRGANYLSGKYGYLGTGIGLSSVQKVVARYGGHLDIRAAHGVFSVSCRLRAASPQPA